MAIGVAVVIVAAVSIGVNKSGLLTADILQGSTMVSALGWDISYKAQQGSLSLQSEKIFHDAQSLSFVVIYDPESVVPDTKKMQTSYDFTSSSWKDGMIHITLFLSGSLSDKENLITLPFSGDDMGITIADATVLFSGWTIDGLAIEKQ